MKSERIGLRFNKKDQDIVSWFLMLEENGIEKSFAVKALLKAFFLNEKINGGTVRIRNNTILEPTSISINENGLNEDIMKIKSQGVKLASFTKDIIRSYICIEEKDEPPQYSELQKIHTKYKLKYLNSIIYNNDTINTTNSNLKSNDHNFNNNEMIKKYHDNMESVNLIENTSNYNKNSEKGLNDEYKNTDNHDMKKSKVKKRNPLLAQI